MIDAITRRPGGPRVLALPLLRGAVDRVAFEPIEHRTPNGAALERSARGTTFTVTFPAASATT